MWVSDLFQNLIISLVIHGFKEKVVIEAPSLYLPILIMIDPEAIPLVYLWNQQKTVPSSPYQEQMSDWNRHKNRSLLYDV